MGNTNLSAARKNRNDEFFTQLEDIENEMKYYRDHFRDKTIFLNCDDPKKSNFWFFFAQNFNFLGLKRLISTHYTGLGSDNPPPSYMLELNRNDDGSEVDVDAPTRTDLEGDGDFRSEESIELLKQSDIVVTNPPFSLFTPYIAQLMEHEKKFLIIGNMNAVTYKEIWPYIQSNEMWLGETRKGSGSMWFTVPDDFPVKTGQRVVDEFQAGDQVTTNVRQQTVGNSAWFTNLDNPRRHEDIIVFRSYEEDPEKYPTYENYDAVEVSKVVDIPKDFGGVMGVPITFLGKHNPAQFEIVGVTESEGKGFSQGLWDESSGTAQAVANGVRKYKRIFIRHKK